MKTAAICTIGDEILIGQIVDTNSSAIAIELNNIGIKVCRMISISDDGTDIKQSIKSLLHNFDIVIVTGGLGPTKDDITKNALAELSGSRGDIFHEGQMQVIERILAHRGIDISDINRAQAMVPDTCEVMVNRKGTAPGMIFRFSPADFTHCPVLYSLPGVPFEAIGLLPDVMADIRRHFALDSIYHKTITTYGIAESTLAKMIEPWEDALPSDMHLAYLPNPLTGVKLRLSIYGGDRDEEIRRIDREFAKVMPVIGDAVYGEGDDTLQSVIAERLTESGLTLSVAESCTGGFLASLFTAMPGASKYFYGSVTSYDNSVKKNILNVSIETIAEHGAVSRECAEAMALGVSRALNTDFAVSTTGIAGPDGGSEDKPVGTVWVGVAYPDTDHPGKTAVISRMFRFNNDRYTNIQRFAGSALNLLRTVLCSVLHA
ncbi:MAG TPA: CinA family nicotinamide mononucleotide deamidase-related protein [Candidatus Coprenecus pullicola]|nr:CinA family nicotinamide mononucleotide deamidase-related protein [Candidatus Coprenecus pullicola]